MQSLVAVEFISEHYVFLLYIKRVRGTTYNFLLSVNYPLCPANRLRARASRLDTFGPVAMATRINSDRNCKN